MAAELYQTVEAEGGRQVAWKIGAGDATAQARFGTDGPFTAPVLDASCLRDGATLRLASLVAPRLEAEIGLRFDGGSAAVLPCIEIIDCRFPGWQIKIASGSLITPVPLEPGRHEVDFGELGTLHLEVTA